MPEAPEVQNVIAYLQEELTGAMIEKCMITYPGLCSNLPVEQFEHDIAGEHFRSFHRLGKYIVIELDDKDLVSHLRMEGKFLIFKNRAAFEAIDPIKDGKHIHAEFDLSDGRILCYRDTRKFGRLSLYEKVKDWRTLPALEKVGKDALDESLSAKDLFEVVKKRKAPIKNILLDQSLIAGIGNIYADEILFEAGISPKSAACHLSLEDWQHIMNAARRILAEAMRCGGSTIRSFSYGTGHAGSYQDQLKVHGKEGKCQNCGTDVVYTRVGQRGTWYCPKCQIEK